ncbi:MAG: hypothetical protein M3247_07310 [Thermoproteota archaeon]|nr:hypothetical protein [Thermoproteota archaeon]
MFVIDEFTNLENTNTRWGRILSQEGYNTTSQLGIDKIKVRIYYIQGDRCRRKLELYPICYGIESISKDT